MKVLSTSLWIKLIKSCSKMPSIFSPVRSFLSKSEWLASVPHFQDQLLYSHTKRSVDSQRMVNFYEANCIFTTLSKCLQFIATTEGNAKNKKTVENERNWKLNLIAMDHYRTVGKLIGKAFFCSFAKLTAFVAYCCFLQNKSIGSYSISAEYIDIPLYVCLVTKRPDWWLFNFLPYMAL